MVHHIDYLNTRDDQALCGAPLPNATDVTRADTADAPCSACEARLVVYHLNWWRDKAQVATAELEELRAKYRELTHSADSYSQHAARTEVEHALVGSSAESPLSEATSFLDRARRELTELCRPFDSAVPFYRLNNLMQEFSDKLDDEERVLLAQEIGSDSSLLRWATTEVERLGLSVSNNRVQENSDMMWEEWLQESQQAPKAKRRFGRPR